MVELLRQTRQSFRIHDGRLISGAVAFYALLATAPLGVLAVVAGSIMVGPQVAQGELYAELSATIGPEVAAYVVELVEEAARPRQSVFATLLSVAFLVYATYRLFDMLRSALNHVWGVRCYVGAGLRGPGRQVLLRRAGGFSLILVLGFAVLAHVGVVVILGVVATWFDGISLPLRVIEQLSSLAILAGVVALVFRFLPDVRVSWRDALVGAVATSALVAAGTWLVGLYFALFSPASAYGAAGSVVALLLFSYYVAQAFFLGAEFTQIWAQAHGHGMTLLPHTMRVEMQERQTIDVMEAA